MSDHYRQIIVSKQVWNPRFARCRGAILLFGKFYLQLHGNEEIWPWGSWLEGGG